MESAFRKVVTIALLIGVAAAFITHPLSRSETANPLGTEQLLRISTRLWDTTGEDGGDVIDNGDEKGNKVSRRKSSYNLGLGKNLPVSGANQTSAESDLYWNVAEPVKKPASPPKVSTKEDGAVAVASAATTAGHLRRTREMVAKTQDDSTLRGALWHEEHFVDEDNKSGQAVEDVESSSSTSSESYQGYLAPPKPKLFYPDIDLSVPDAVYSGDYDAVWELMRWEAFQEAQREPLLVSFLHSSILNHKTLESSLAFLLANRLASQAMISTQVQSLILEALDEDDSIGRSLRADIMAVRDRDPACTCLPDVFLYFKGFHALQTYRVAHVLWKAGKKVLAHYLQSQMSQSFQIDIHPNATLGSGIMLDHGTGIVIGETARVGHNCSILHHVTLGGSGKKGRDRHPKVGEGVLLGAGASVLGNVAIGDGCQVGAGTLVITDLPSHCVAVGVPAKIIGSFVDVTEQPSIGMNQMMDKKIVTFESDGI